ncbi:hypothetical protein ACFQXA_36350 [Nocardiopsis composta]
MGTLWRAVADIVGIFAGLLFNPMVWAGVVVGGIAVVLFVASGFMRARGMGVRDPKAAEKPKAAGAGQAEGIAGPAPTAPQPGRSSPGRRRRRASPPGETTTSATSRTCSASTGSSDGPPPGPGAGPVPA